jgi:hypothetical protein
VFSVTSPAGSDIHIARGAHQGPFGGQLFDWLWAPVHDHDLVPAAPETARHIGPHPSQSDRSALHRLCLLWIVHDPLADACSPTTPAVCSVGSSQRGAARDAPSQEGDEHPSIKSRYTNAAQYWVVDVKCSSGAGDADGAGDEHGARLGRTVRLVLQPVEFAAAGANPRARARRLFSLAAGDRVPTRPRPLAHRPVSSGSAPSAC